MLTPDFLRLMKEAARLTQSGDFTAATATVRQAMGGAPFQPAAGNPFEAAGGNSSEASVIDVEAHEVAPRADDQANYPGANANPAQAAAASPGRADGGAASQFLQGSYSGPAQAGQMPACTRREYKLFVPPNASAHPRPLIVMLHGCTQNPDDFAAGTAMNDAAAEHGFFVLYPAQSQEANPQRCWNWFKHNHQQRDRGEPALLAGMTREIMSRYAIDPDRVYVAGLSAGGAMAAILADTYPDLYAAAGVHSGLAAGIASDLPQALSAMNGGGTPKRGAPNGVPTIVFQGDADTTVHPSNAEHIIRASTGAGAASIEQHAVQPHAGGGRTCSKQIYHNADGTVAAEYWLVHGTAHAWSGGAAKGSYTDSRGPDASAEMVRFFFAHPRRAAH